MIRTLLISCICPLKIDNVNSLLADTNELRAGVLASSNRQLCEAILKERLTNF
jgi:hypothetical protein